MKIKDYIIVVLLLIAGNFYVTNQTLNIVNEHKAAIISQDSILNSHATLIPQLLQAVNSQFITNEIVSRTLLSTSPEAVKEAQQVTQKRLEEAKKTAATTPDSDPTPTPSDDSK